MKCILADALGSDCNVRRLIDVAIVDREEDVSTQDVQHCKHLVANSVE